MKTTKTFKSGNSVAVRLPRALGVEPGVEMIVREERGRYIVEPVEGGAEEDRPHRDCGLDAVAQASDPGGADHGAARMASLGMEVLKRD